MQIPLLAVGSLDALTEVAREDYEAGIIRVDDWDRALLCPMVDARRMEVYAQVFDSEGHPLSEVSAEVVGPESFARFRSEEMDVDSLAAEVKRATELIASCKARLRKAEADVNKILE